MIFFSFRSSLLIIYSKFLYFLRSIHLPLDSLNNKAYHKSNVLIQFVICNVESIIFELYNVITCNSYVITLANFSLRSRLL